MSAVSTIPLVSLRRDGGTQVRAEMKAETVEAYAEALGEGATFPPVVVFFDGKDHWLADGFHRVLAHEKAGLVDILADVRDGSKRDALLFAVGANATHGLARSNKDKRRAVLMVLSDREWATQFNNREIAKITQVSEEMVRQVRNAEFPTVGNSETRTGKDGKQYPTRKTKTVEAPVKTDAEPDEYTPHPLLAEIENAADLDALDRAFNKVATAGLDEDEATEAGDIYRRRKMELRAAAGEVDADALVKRLTDAVATMTYAQHEMVMDSIIAAHASKVITQEQWATLDKAWWEKLNALKREMAKTDSEKIGASAHYEQRDQDRLVGSPPPAPPPTPPRGQVEMFTQPSVAVCTQEPAQQPVSAETVTVSKAEWEALTTWQNGIVSRAGVGDTASVGKAMRLIGLTKSDNEHEASSAALKACRIILERGLIVGTSQSAIEDAELFESRRARDAAWEELQREIRAARGGAR